MRERIALGLAFIVVTIIASLILDRGVEAAPDQETQVAEAAAAG